MTIHLSDKAQTALDAVVARFQSGDLSPVVDIARIQREGGPVPMDHWSFGNKLLAYLQSGSLDCRSFTDWQKVGRCPRKGSHACFILEPLTYKVRDDRTGEERTVMRGFRSGPRYAAHDTDGEPLPEEHYEPVDLPPLADVARAWGVQVTYMPTGPGKLGSCSIDGARIALGSQDAAIFFHELGHAAHARIEGKLKGGQHVDQETVAEFVSVVLMYLYGLGDRTGNAWHYISHYAQDPLEAIARAMDTVGQVLDLLFGKEELHDTVDLSLASA